MNTAFYTAISGMRTFQSALDITANNMANVNTTAYKAERGAFQDLLYTQMDVKSGELLTGHGVKMSDVQPVFIQGAFEKSGQPLDFAITGDGFFAVEKGNGGTQPLYTRDGSFKISVSEEGDFLATRDGYFVLDGDGKRIQLTKKVVKDKDGKEQATNQLDLDGLNKKIGLFTCDNPEGLVHMGNNRYRSGEFSGQWTAVKEQTNSNRIVSGALELSGTELSSEMVNVIEAQRAFQLNGRIVTTADQIEEIINNLR